MAKKRVDNPDESEEMPTIEREDTSFFQRGGGYGYDNEVYGHSSRTEEKITSAQSADRWRNRRRMAYISLLAMIAATVALFFFVPVERLSDLQDPAGWFFISMASIVGSYVGFATYDDIRNRFGK